MTPHIRPATLADAEAIADLLNAIIRVGGTTAYIHEKPAQAIRDMMSSAPGRSSWVVGEDAQRQLLGFQFLMPHTDLPDHVGSIATFVRIGITKSGVGSAMFEATRAAAPDLGFTEIDATIRADNTGGLAYYSSRGFTDFGVTPDVPLDDGTHVDRIHKRLVL